MWIQEQDQEKNLDPKAGTARWQENKRIGPRTQPKIIVKLYLQFRAPKNSYRI